MVLSVEDAAEEGLLPLSIREAEDNEYMDDETGLFPWKIRKSSPRIIVNKIEYYKREVIVPTLSIVSTKTDLYDKPEEDYGFLF